MILFQNNVHNMLELKELTENFALFDDWEERYRYLIDLGRKIPAMDDSLKTDETLVRGCTSRVWMVPEIRDDRLYFQADSDAHIVRGLVAILIAAYQGQSLEHVRTLDIEAVFNGLGLGQHLSPSRRNGFFSMVDKIRSL